MSTKPLSYDSLKTVLQHMEANLRFQLSRCIPSIRVAEKSVPLKIDRLVFNKTSITVNKTNYILGIHRKYRAPIVPGHLDYTNEEGVVHHDIDEYGVQDDTADKILLPGDVAIGGSFFELDAMTDDEHIEDLEEELNSREKVLAECMANPNGGSCEMLKQLIYLRRTVLLSYYRRRNQTLPLYNSFIQLEIDSPRGKQVEHVWYNVKLREALKSLNESFFGKRRHVVNVKVLNTYSVNIIRLPLGLKLKIRKLIASKSIPTIYEALQPIVEKSSYPLNYLALTGDNIEDIEHHIVQTAAKLNLLWKTYNISLLHALLNLKNKIVYVRVLLEQFPNEERIFLIQNWLETGREIGTCFSFSIHKKKKTVTEFMDLIEKRFDGALLGERNAVLPINEVSELNISFKEDFKRQGLHWILQMKVLPIRSSIFSK